MQALQELQVRSLGWEDILDEGMETTPGTPNLGNSMDRVAWWAYSPWGQKSQTRLNTQALPGTL